MTEDKTRPRTIRYVAVLIEGDYMHVEGGIALRADPEAVKQWIKVAGPNCVLAEVHIPAVNTRVGPCPTCGWTEKGCSPGACVHEAPCSHCGKPATTIACGVGGCPLGADL